MNTLTDKELTVIDKIGNNSGKITQRTIAKDTGLSLGLTNIILQKLVHTGYIKIKQLTPKKMHYILSSKGIVEKTNKSYHYIFKTIGEVRKINNKIQDLFEREYQKGSRRIAIVGNNDLTEMIKIFAKNINNLEVLWYDGNLLDQNIQDVDLIIDCTGGNNGLMNAKTINLMEYITVNANYE